MHALLLGLLLAAAPAKGGEAPKRAATAENSKVDPGATVKPFRVKVVNDYAETMFTVTYTVTYADGSKPATGTLLKDEHIKANSSKKSADEVPVKNAKDKVAFKIAATSLGETSNFKTELDMSAKLRVFIITYDYDAAEAKFRTMTRWGIL